MGFWGRRAGWICLCALALLGRTAWAWDGESVSLKLENDATVSSDRHYTQGGLLSYMSADDGLPGWMKVVSDNLPTFGYKVGAAKWGVGFGQEIYTPENLLSPVLQTNDRPYAGWLFARFSLQRRGELAPRWSVLENFHLDLGVIGPESQAEDTQKVWHGKDPQGWAHQLKSELGVALRYERLFYFDAIRWDDGWGLQVIPHVGGSAGNIATLMNAGGTLRFGYNLPDESAVGREELKWGAYLHAGTDGRFVLHNIFLDGNTWHSSHRVTKRPFVGDVWIGLGIVLKNVELSFAQYLRSREFNDQKTADSFGSATLAVKF
jgi:lipid A 3-O-deacylase